MTRYSKRVAKTFEDISEGDYYADSDGHWVTLKEGWERDGGRIVHEVMAEEMIAARRECRPVRLQRSLVGRASSDVEKPRR